MKALKIIAVTIVILLAMFGAFVLGAWLWTQAVNSPMTTMKPTAAKPAACWRAV